MSYSLRPAQLDDVGAVLALWREADAQPSHTDDLDGVTALLEHDPDALLLAEGEHRIVGSVIAAWDGWRGSIYRLAVAKDHRRHGLGRVLVDAACERLDRLGARRLQAIVNASDPQALGFWLASDWERQDERSRFVKG